jgi:hypothetical protein
MKEVVLLLSEFALPCPHCRKATIRTFTWVQENTEMACDHCARTAPIDKRRIEASLDDQEGLVAWF